jgi:hypothetical protein
LRFNPSDLADIRRAFYLTGILSLVRHFVDTSRNVESLCINQSVDDSNPHRFGNAGNYYILRTNAGVATLLTSIDDLPPFAVTDAWDIDPMIALLLQQEQDSGKKKDGDGGGIGKKVAYVVASILLLPFTLLGCKKAEEPKPSAPEPVKPPEKQGDDASKDFVLVTMPRFSYSDTAYDLETADDKKATWKAWTKVKDDQVEVLEVLSVESGTRTGGATGVLKETNTITETVSVEVVPALPAKEAYLYVRFKKNIAEATGFPWTTAQSTTVLFHVKATFKLEKREWPRNDGTIVAS